MFVGLNYPNKMKNLKNYLLVGLLFAFGLGFTACSDDDEAPDEEEGVEVITNLTLRFTPAGSGAAVTAEAIDPDGAGSAPLEVQGPINLAAGTEYTLTFDIINALDPNDPEDIGEEIAEEDDEHQFFFAFTDGIFTDPTGNGNIDNAADAINYNDEDGNGCALGLSTSWTTSDMQSGTFTVRLQHQPDIKTCSTGANDGDTDFNVQFTLNVQ